MTSITDVARKVEEVMEKKDFSGVVLLQQNGKTLFSKARGYANRSEQISNTSDTRFGIASGCKVFTAVSICQLIEQGKFSYESRLVDVLNIEFPLWDKEITVHQLLTHTAGIPDYFDEEVMEDFAELWQERPVYMMQQLRDFLPMFQNLAMKSAPGERFHYNNAGYIVLGLIVEQQSGQSFTEYVESHIFKPSGMKDSGYFRTDQLPPNTAIGYVDQEEGTWNTNIFSIPIQGGSDGGAYITAQDMIHFWHALLGYKLLTEESTRKLLIPYSHQEDEEYYGRGIWIDQKGEDIFKYHVMGFDPGVSFMSSVYPVQGIQLVVLSNQEWGPYPVTLAIEESLLV
ncbi:penicillin-binding protein [Paenibacillus sp. Root52]|uniref:CubicO group peptidase (Beta-lactamase class C family) n=1 Tax=Paenibacillus amylolyticus TaxID=1451 RepID=A0AAP5LKI9_PAEAM|nr:MULTISPECIES: serine hydrolase [Paenibacillus]KQY94036.1 penicillin-binding protein [Paenibacillus sp. Root52]MDR6722001.1 CubicO group peptidase (beta-lactamase class C family) [Paenibacillus amylolyticus]